MRIILAIALSFFLLAPSAHAEKKETKETPDVASDINKPRSDARKISFDVSEGTWMSVDLSPDGSTLVFDLLGDIYTMPVAGGTAAAISSGPAYDHHPRYSPDGKTIAFSSDRGGMENVWLMNADGKNPRIVSEEKDSYLRSAAWTPDGNYLILRKEDGKKAGIPPVELWMYHVRGGTGIRITNKDEFNNASGPVVSADGRFIYFARRGPFSYTPDISFGLWQIQRYDRNTGETAQLTSGYGGAARPAISPDGKTLVFVSRRDKDTILVERNLDSGAERILVSGVSRDEQEGFAQMDIWPNYTFTRDGKAIIYSSNGKFQKLDLQSKQITEIPFQAKVEQYLAPRVAWQEKMDMGPVNAKLLRWPRQSNDGRWISFSAFGRIWLQEVKEGKIAGAPRRLTADDAALPKREYSPNFSSDGKWIAFVTWSDSEGGHVWKTQIPESGTATPQKLTKTAGHYINPTWSPDNTRLLIISGSGLEFRGRQPEEEGSFEIRWMPAEGGTMQFISSITIPSTFRFHPEAYFSKDGTRIYYRDTLPPKPGEEQKSELVSIRIDGSDKKRHLRFPSVGDIVPSPEDDWVLFTSRDSVYITSIPAIQMKEPPDVSPKDGAVPVWRLSENAGGYVNWTNNGQAITWILGNQFHRLQIADALKFSEEQKLKAAKKDPPAEDKKKDGKDKADKKEEDAKVPKSEVLTISLSMPRSIPSGSVLFRGARVISMKGEEVIENADVLVTNNRIAAIGAANSVTAPSDAKIMDATGKTIIPGLIDTHAHLHYSGFELHPDSKWEYITNLAYGVTTTYDPSAPSLDVFAQAEMVEAGVMTGPRIYSSGDVLYGGQPFDFYAEVANQKDADAQVLRMKAYGARMIKVYQQPRREQRLWFAEACRKHKMLLTAEGAGELNTDLTMALDGFTAFEHSLPVALKNDVVSLVAKSSTFYTPTLLVSYGGPWGELYFRQTRNPHSDPKLNRFAPHFSLDPLGRRHPSFLIEEFHFPTVARGAAEILRAGGNVSLGAHGQQQGLGVHWELWAMAGDGQPEGMKAMTPMESLRSATILAADKLGFSPDLGSVETGKLADFLVLDANPLEDIHNTEKIKWVVKNGEVYDAETMRQEWPQQRDLPRFFWAAPQ